MNVQGEDRVHEFTEENTEVLSVNIAIFPHPLSHSVQPGGEILCVMNLLSLWAQSQGRQGMIPIASFSLSLFPTS